MRLQRYENLLTFANKMHFSFPIILKKCIICIILTAYRKKTHSKFANVNNFSYFCTSVACESVRYDKLACHP